MNFFLSSSDSGSYWYGAPATDIAGDIHWVFDFILWTSAIFFVIIVAMGAYFVVKYRRRPGVDAQKTASHNTALELLWSVIPTILVVAMFWYGFDTYMDLKRIPPDTYTINVTAKKWAWSYEYPNGLQTEELYVPVGKNIELVLASQDVLHSYSVPDFAVKMDCVPGRYNKLWFRANKPTLVNGEDNPHVVFCTEYCGAQHSQMMSKVHVFEPADFEAWYEKASNFMDDPAIPAEVKGEKIYKIQGCAACHTLTGENMFVSGGPTFKNLWGNEREFTDGSVFKADGGENTFESYIRESILNPNKRIVKGYPANRMPNFQGRLEEDAIKYLIAFIKAQKEQ